MSVKNVQNIKVFIKVWETLQILTFEIIWSAMIYVRECMACHWGGESPLKQLRPSDKRPLHHPAPQSRDDLWMDATCNPMLSIELIWIAVEGLLGDGVVIMPRGRVIWMGLFNRGCWQISMLLSALLLCAPAREPGSVAVMAVSMMEELRARWKMFSSNHLFHPVRLTYGKRNPSVRASLEVLAGWLHEELVLLELNPNVMLTLLCNFLM